MLQCISGWSGLRLLLNLRKGISINFVLPKLVVVIYWPIKLSASNWSNDFEHTKQGNLGFHFVNRGAGHVILALLWKQEDCLLLRTGEKGSDRYHKGEWIQDFRQLSFRGTWSPTTCWCQLQWKARSAMSQLSNTQKFWLERYGRVRLFCFVWSQLQAPWDRWRWSSWWCQW